jgi:selenocysteine-specific elongation factor
MAERRFKPEFPPALVGTAGHVDHGKTSLVQWLTGCDTDRLPEEKARGLSIDLGFAPCLLPGKRIVGIVDVPGHTDFIRNMVAGAASIDVLLLVTAADDGVMPQTDEHIKIVKLLRTPHVMVALTKTDLVAPERVVQVRADLSAFLADNGFPDAPVVPVSNKTGDGIEEVRQALTALVERATQRPPDPRVFRMNVERTFSVKGLGTVVTGIPLSGRIGVGGKAELLPAGKPCVIRTIQTFKFDTDAAQASVCAAINIRDVEPEDAARGMTLAAPGYFQPTTAVVATLRNVSTTFCFKRMTDVRLHAGTSSVLATARLLPAPPSPDAPATSATDEEELRPGYEGFALLKLAEPMVLAAGDQYILRSLSPVATVAGGTVLSSRPQQIKGKHPEIAERLHAAAASVRQGDLLGAELLAGPEPALPASGLQRLTQLPEPRATEAIRASEARGQIVNLGGAWLVAARREELLRVLRPALTRYHAEHRYAWGMAPAHVCSLLSLEAQCFPKLAEALCAGKEFAVKHGRLARADFQPAISASEMKVRDDLLGRITAAGINAPARGDLATAMKLSEQEMRLAVQLLVEDGSIKVLDKNLIAAEVYASCRRKLIELFAATPVVDITAFRKALGASRNLAFIMLDAFDGEGLTRRVENGRVLARKPS